MEKKHKETRIKVGDSSQKALTMMEPNTDADCSESMMTPFVSVFVNDAVNASVRVKQEPCVEGETIAAIKDERANFIVPCNLDLPEHCRQTDIKTEIKQEPPCSEVTSPESQDALMCDTQNMVQGDEFVLPHSTRLDMEDVWTHESEDSSSVFNIGLINQREDKPNTNVNTEDNNSFKTTDDSIKRFICEKCGKRFITSSNLKRHNLIHEGVKAHKCDICERRFTLLAHLRAHKFAHEGKRPYKCEICEKTFIQMSHLKAHKVLHESVSPHKCQTCGKCFPFIGNLKQHYLIHEGKRDHKCDICGKSFKRASHLKQHNLIHEGNKQYKCTLCDKSFTHSSYLKQHILVHEGKRKHVCLVCHKSFMRATHLKEHHLIHQGIRRHKCAICDKAFIRANDLKVHLNSHEKKNNAQTDHT